MSKGKKSTRKIDLSNPAFNYVEKDVEIYKYFEDYMYVGNTDAWDSIKKIISELKARILKLKTNATSVYAISLTAERIPKLRTENDFVHYGHELDVLNIDTETDKLRKNLAKIVKAIQTLEYRKDFETKYRVTFICYKKKRGQ